MRLPINLPHFPSEFYLRCYNATIAIAITERLLDPRGDSDVPQSILLSETGPSTLDRTKPESVYAALLLFLHDYADREKPEVATERTWRQLGEQRLTAYPDGVAGIDIDGWCEMMNIVLGVDVDSPVLRYFLFAPEDLRHPSPLIGTVKPAKAPKSSEERQPKIPPPGSYSKPPAK